MNYDFLFRPAGLQTGKTPVSTATPPAPMVKKEVMEESDSMSSGEEDSKKLGGRHAEAKRRATNHQEPPPPLRTEGKPNLARFAKIDEAIKLDIAELHEIKMTRDYILTPTPAEAPKSAKPPKKKAKPSSDSKDRTGSTRFYQENPLAIPALHPLFEQVVSRVPYINYSQLGTGLAQTLTNAQLTQWLKVKGGCAPFLKPPLDG